VKTDKLVEALAQGAEPVRPGTVGRRIVLAGGAGLVLAFALMTTLFGVRTDFGDAFIVVLLKSAFGALAVAAALPLLFEVARPNTSAKRAAAPAALFAVASVALAVVAYLMTPAGARADAWLGGGMPECLYRTPLLAAPIAAVFFVAVRGLGPTRLSLAGATIGGVSGGLAAIAYAACCPMDSALYVASWYLAAIAFCAAVGAVVIGRALKW
jgi:hypothetical protein